MLHQGRTRVEKSLKRQRGLGWFGLTLVFGTIAFAAIVAIKLGPLFMNQMTVARVVKAVANDPDMATADAAKIRLALQRHWAIDYINYVDFKDIMIKRNEHGRYLEYDYEARVNLFYNVFVVVHFEGKDPMRNSADAPPL